MHLFHKWGKWEDYIATWYSPITRKEWDSIIQIQRCRKCGKKKTRRLTDAY